MKTCRSRTYNVIVPCGVGIVVALGAPGLGQRVREAYGATLGQEQSGDRSSWELRRGGEAIECTCRILGLTGAGSPKARASLVTLKEDSTPYVSEQLVGKPLWHVILPDWSFEVKSYPVGYEDLYMRTADVYLDPVNGRVLKLKTRWPKGVPEMPPEVSAEVGAAQMAKFGRMRYHGFPPKAPKISFLEALDSIWRLAGDSPMEAKQVVAYYVMWSKMGREPRAVWSVMLRGVAVHKPLPGTPKDMQDQYTYIIDAETGEWILTTNTPQAQKSQDTGE